MNRIQASFFGVMFAFSALACDPATGERSQTVDADWNGKRLASWEVDSSEPKVIHVPNGFKLGVLIQDATTEKYSELKKLAWPYVPELVSIVLYDMGSSLPRELTMTWGGANSIQGYGSEGGADRVEELGNPGLVLHLMKPVCFDES